MLSKIEQIWEGWKNDLFPPKKLKELIANTQAERLAICKNCPFNSTEGRITSLSHCKDCGCILKKKTACLHCKCPQEKWKDVLTPEELDKLQKQINQENESYNT